MKGNNFLTKAKNPDPVDGYEAMIRIERYQMELTRLMDRDLFMTDHQRSKVMEEIMGLTVWLREKRNTMSIIVEITPEEGLAV